jgi:DNA-binding CsgD family transcriptional regulator
MSMKKTKSSGEAKRMRQLAREQAAERHRQIILYRRAKRHARQLKRARAMERLYESGQTLQQIGAAHGITRERVRQLLNLIKKPTGERNTARINRPAKLKPWRRPKPGEAPRTPAGPPWMKAGGSAFDIK